MKKTILIITLTFFLTGSLFAQVTAGQVDDFEDGTTQGWEEGASTPNPPVNISTGGPTGVNDNYLQNLSAGGGGPGSKMVFYNQTQWTGDFTSQGIVAIKFDVKALTNNLNIRVAFDGGGGKFCTTTPINITAGGAWTHVVIPISAGDFTAVGGSDIADTLLDVNTMRILSSTNPSWQGDSIAATIEIDNIEAATSLSIDNKELVQFSISPNPSSFKLNVSLTQNTNDAKIEVYDILGKRIYAQLLTNMQTSINVSRWNAGVYLVKITNKTGTQTKRFVKE